MTTSPLAGTSLPPSAPGGRAASGHGVFHGFAPTPANPAQRVSFGTSGHRGSSFDGTFQRGRISWRSAKRCATHRLGGRGERAAVHRHRYPRSLSRPALATCRWRCSPPTGWTRSSTSTTATHPRRSSRAPSWPIIAARISGLADGVVITPSHNPPGRRRLQIQHARRRAGRHRRDG